MDRLFQASYELRDDTGKLLPAESLEKLGACAVAVEEVGFSVGLPPSADLPPPPRGSGIADEHKTLARRRRPQVTSPLMRHILLISLYLGLNDLLTTKRLAALQSFAAGKANVKLVTILRDAMAALPAVIAGRPLVDELDATDARHDTLGYALWHFVEAYLQHPDTLPALIQAAKKIRAAFLPTLEDLGASYPAEAQAAMDRKPALGTLKAELDLFPVAGGGTLYDWAASFLKAGESIDSLLSARADIDAKGRAEASRLRGEAIGLLNRMRKSLALEMKHDPSLPADLDAQVFGYFDLLEKTAAEAQAAAKAAKAKAKAAAAPAAPEAPTGGEGKGP